MPEWENPKIFESGYGPDIESIRLDLYRLLNQFVASRHLSELCEDDPYLNHAMYSLDHFFEIEATRILLSSAVIARVVDDRDNHLKDYSTRCGTWVKDVKGTEVIDLSLREACNKIIHARTVRYDVEVGRQGYDQRLFSPYMYYYGSYQGKQWKATLDVIDYVKVYTDHVL